MPRYRLCHTGTGPADTPAFPVRCRSRLYISELPTVSVVVPFHNEHLSTLLRTAASLINRAPRHLLREVLLVDDASTKGGTEDRDAAGDMVIGVTRAIEGPMAECPPTP